MFMFRTTARKTVNRSIPKLLGMTLPRFQSRNCGSFESDGAIEAFISKHPHIDESIKKENIPISCFMNQNIADLERWNDSSIQKIYHYGHLEFQRFLSLSSLEKNKLCDLVYYDNGWCCFALDTKIVTIQELIDNPSQDVVDFMALTMRITRHDIKLGYESPTCSMTFDEFIKLTPQNRKELLRSSMNLWKNELTIAEFFALPKVDRDDLRVIFSTSLGRAALVQKKLNIKQLLGWSHQQRMAMYDLIHVNDYETVKDQISYLHRLLNHPLFDLEKFVDLHPLGRCIEIHRMKDLLMSEESIDNKNSFN